MPTYDYECDACGHTFEEFQNITADPLTKCPECKKKKLRRLFGTGAAVMFKGSGFYQTDYRSDSYKKAAKNDSPKSSDAGSKSDSAGKGDSGATSGSDNKSASSHKSDSGGKSRSGGKSNSGGKETSGS